MASKFLLRALAITIFSLVTETHFSPVQCNTKLIARTCKQTPFHELCYSTLVEDPKSSTANVVGLGLIIVDKIKAKATATLNHIHQLLKSSPSLKHPLTSCASKYDAIVTADIPEAIEGLHLGNFKFAQIGLDDAALEAKYCENDFDGKSPLTSENKVVYAYSAIASAIVVQLLKSPSYSSETTND